MTLLRNAFSAARDEGSILPIFEPFLNSRLFIIGALDGNNKPNITLKKSPVSENLCATVSEDRRWLVDVPQSRILKITGHDLVNLIGKGRDIVIVYQSGGDILRSDQIDAFQEALS